MSTNKKAYLAQYRHLPTYYKIAKMAYNEGMNDQAAIDLDFANLKKEVIKLRAENKEQRELLDDPDRMIEMIGGM